MWCRPIRRYRPECFIHRPVPTDEGAGGEEQKPEDGEAKAYTVVRVHTKHSEAGEQVEDQSASWTFIEEQKKTNKKNGST